MSETKETDIPEQEIDPDVANTGVEDAQNAESEAGGQTDVETALETLRKQLADSEEARRRAEHDALTARQQATQAQGQAHDTEAQLVANALSTVTNNLTHLKRNYAEALAAQDWEAAANVNEQIAEAVEAKKQLERGQEAMKNRPPPTPPQQVDPVEAIASQLSPRSAAWVRAHPEYARDPRLMQQAASAANFIASKGTPVDSDEYFSSLEKMLDIDPRQTEMPDPMADAARATQRRAAPAAAPVSRNGGQINSARRTTAATLSPLQQEHAEAMGMSLEEYARNFNELRKEGRIH